MRDSYIIVGRKEIGVSQLYAAIFTKLNTITGPDVPNGQEACDWRCDWRWGLLLMQGLWSEGAHTSRNEEVHVSLNRPWAVITWAKVCVRTAPAGTSTDSSTVLPALVLVNADGRMRRSCSPFEAWRAWQRSRFAARCGNCLNGCGSCSRRSSG